MTPGSLASESADCGRAPFRRAPLRSYSGRKAEAAAHFSIGLVDGRHSAAL